MDEGVVAVGCHSLPAALSGGSVARRGQAVLPGPEADSPVRGQVRASPGRASSLAGELDRHDRSVLATRLEGPPEPLGHRVHLGPAMSSDAAPEPAGVAGDQDR